MATEHDLSVARDVGELRADMRTVKHDLGSIQQGQIALAAKFDAATTSLNDKLNLVNTQQQRGLGFFAGAAAVVTVFGGILIAFFKLAFGGFIADGRLHP